MIDEVRGAVTAWVRVHDLFTMVFALAVVRLFARSHQSPGRRLFVCGLQWLLLVPLALLAAGLCAQGRIAGGACLVMVVTFAFPWAVTRYLLIPTGRWRLAAWVTRSSGWVWHQDPAGGALVAAAWAALRAGGEPSALAWVERRCEQHVPGNAAVLLAQGLVMAARGERHGARRWIASLCGSEPAMTPVLTRTLAAQWCAAEAIERGAWSEVVALGRVEPSSRTLALLGAIAARISGAEPVPTDAELSRLARWVPSRRALAPLLVQARTAPLVPAPQKDRSAAGASESPVRDPLAVALALHRGLLATSGRWAPLVERLERTAWAWDQALTDGACADALRRRSAALGAGVDALEQLRQRAELDLVEFCIARGVEIGSVGRPSPALARLRRRLAQRLLDELELTCDVLLTRVRQGRALSTQDEWRAWLDLTDHYARTLALAGVELRPVAFDMLHESGCALAVWLWNTRGEKPYAHQMFVWLLGQAELAENHGAIELQRRNVANSGR